VIISSSDEEGESEETLEDPIYEGYRAILDCKVAEESLVGKSSFRSLQIQSIEKKITF